MMTLEPIRKYFSNSIDNRLIGIELLKKSGCDIEEILRFVWSIESIPGDVWTEIANPIILHLSNIHSRIVVSNIEEKVRDNYTEYSGTANEFYTKWKR